MAYKSEPQHRDAACESRVEALALRYIRLQPEFGAAQQRLPNPIDTGGRGAADDEGIGTIIGPSIRSYERGG